MAHALTTLFFAAVGGFAVWLITWEVRRNWEAIMVALSYQEPRGPFEVADPITGADWCALLGFVVAVLILVLA